MAEFLSWLHSPSEVAQDLIGFVRVNIVDRIDHNSSRFADTMKQWMQQNAPWDDQTGAARDTLNVQVERAGNLFIFTLQHGVPYGFFLETMQAGRFSILGPAVLYFGPKTTDLVKAGS